MVVSALADRSWENDDIRAFSISVLPTVLVLAHLVWCLMCLILFCLSLYVYDALQSPSHKLKLLILLVLCVCVCVCVGVLSPGQLLVSLAGEQDVLL